MPHKACPKEALVLIMVEIWQRQTINATLSHSNAVCPSALVFIYSCLVICASLRLPCCGCQFSSQLALLPITKTVMFPVYTCCRTLHCRREDPQLPILAISHCASPQSSLAEPYMQSELLSANFQNCNSSLLLHVSQCCISKQWPVASRKHFAQVG